MIRTSMKTETSLQTSKSCLTFDDDLALDDEEYHEALLGTIVDKIITVTNKK